MNPVNYYTYRDYPMSNSDTQDKPKITTNIKNSGPGIVKKALSIIAIVFVLLVIPATINTVLSTQTQDPRNKAQVITDQAATDIQLNSNTNQNTSKSKDFNFGDLIMSIYPFVVGIVIIIWAVLLFIYFGLKFGNKKKL